MLFRSLLAIALFAVCCCSQWTKDTSVGSTKQWSSITSSADGTKLVVAVEGGYLWRSGKICPDVADGTCDTCSDDATTCTAVSCAANKFNPNGNAVDGCESAYNCVVVADGTCTACTSTIASGCTAVTCNTGFVSFCYCCYCFTLQDIFFTAREFFSNKPFKIFPTPPPLYF